MKCIVLYISIGILFLQGKVNGQLIDNREGDSQFTPLISSTNQFTVLKLNTVDPSIGAEYYTNNLNDKFYSYKLKAKSTNGISSLFNNGAFSPGVSLGMTRTNVSIFDPNNKKDEKNMFLDWATLYANYDINNYSLFKQDTTFKNQIFTKNFKGLSIGVIYNILVKSKYQFSMKVGYERINNFNELKKRVLQDVISEYDPDTNTTRNKIEEKEAREGLYKEGDIYPVRFSFTKLIPYIESSNSYNMGYSIYFNSNPRNGYKPVSNLGAVIYLAKSGDVNQIPVLSINFQINDIFDVKGLNNGILNRFGIGLSTNFTFI